MKRSIRSGCSDPARYSHIVGQPVVCVVEASKPAPDDDLTGVD